MGTQVVVSSQLATKMVNADGSTGNFETGARGVMMPSLGMPLEFCNFRRKLNFRAGSGYVPNSKTYRVILAPDGLRSGYNLVSTFVNLFSLTFASVLKLTSSPKHPETDFPMSAAYSLVCQKFR